MVFIGEAAGVQFQGARALCVRGIRVDERQTYEGWLWLDGYVVNERVTLSSAGPSSFGRLGRVRRFFGGPHSSGRPEASAYCRECG